MPEARLRPGVTLREAQAEVNVLWSQLRRTRPANPADGGVLLSPGGANPEKQKELVALAPFCVQPRSLSNARPFAVLEFLGSGFVGSDYLDVIVRKGSEAQAQQALTSWLSARRLPLKLTNVKRGASSGRSRGRPASAGSSGA